MGVFACFCKFEIITSCSSHSPCPQRPGSLWVLGGVMNRRALKTIQCDSDVFPTMPGWKGELASGRDCV